MLFPEEIFPEKESEQDHIKDNPARKAPEKFNKLILIYDHYVLTLKDELKQRINNRDPFSLQELWYLLYSMVQGAQELTEIHAVFNPDQPLIINP
jgi:hypothetical protein